jgi:hypothetical protein
MHKSLRLALALTLLVAPSFAVAKEKEDPKKFKYTPIPVEASCLEGYHPTVDPQWGNVFPCIKDAEIVAPTGTTPSVVASPATIH